MANDRWSLIQEIGARYTCSRPDCIWQKEYGPLIAFPDESHDCECGAPMTEVKS